MSPNPKEVEALTALLEQAGLDAADLLSAITTLAAAKKTASEKVVKEGEKKNVIDKEEVYPGESAIIYRRGDTKTNIYYFRTYDRRSKRQYVKSLETTDRVKALSKARLLFQEIRGKIEKNERIRSITTEELIEKHLKNLKPRITNVPHMGITEGTLRNKVYFLSKWQEYINYLGYKSRTIDAIPKEKTRDFGIWFLNQPKKTGNILQERSRERINNCITEVISMYHKTAIRDRYISMDKMPEIDRLKEGRDDSYKRDIFTEEEYDKFWKYLEYCYSRGKKLDENGNKVEDVLVKRDADEIYKRKIFAKVMGILYNTGMRPNELLGLRWNEVSTNPNDDEKGQAERYRVVVRAENSKNGIRRVIVAPVKKRFDTIRDCYKLMGIDVTPTDYVLLNPSKGRQPYTRQNLYQRLKRVLRDSGLENELNLQGKSITLYASRHFFITMRLRYGKVPLYLLSKVVGSSVKNLTDVYGHIDTEMEADIITKNMGRMVKSGFDIRSDITGDETDD